MEKIKVFVLVAVFLMLMSLSNKRLKTFHIESRKEPLHDLGHKLFNKIPEDYHHIVDISLTVILLYAVYKIRSTKTIKFMIIETLTVLFIRMISINLTIMPSSNSECIIGHSKFLSESQCNDMMFSGHTSLVFLLLLNMYHNSIINKLQFSTILLSYISILLATRSHYSVDIYIAIVISFLTDFCFRSQNFEGQKFRTL